MKKNNWSNIRREMFYMELHALLTAGLDFSAAFRLLINEEQDKRVKPFLERLYGEVVGGASLWQAMERSGAFRRLEYGVVRIGDETGRLAETLAFLGSYFRKQVAQRRMLSSAVSYPFVILATAAVVVVFMLVVVVPMFTEVYARMGGELPALTQAVVAFAELFPAYATIAVAIIAAVYMILHINRHRKEVQQWSANFLLRLPVAGTMLRKNYQAQFCKLLCLLTSSGVPLLTAVDMLCEVVDCWPYNRSFERIACFLEQGGSFAAGVAASPDLYGRKLVSLLRLGEETNRLPEMLRQQGDALDEELELGIKQLGALLEPVLILFVGLLVAVVLIAMYLPMFRLGGVMG